MSRTIMQQAMDVWGVEWDVLTVRSAEGAPNVLLGYPAAENRRGGAGGKAFLGP